MTETEILKLKKPAPNDYYSVEDFNENMDKLEAQAAVEKSKSVILRVFADLNSVVAVSHRSGTYSGIATQHTDYQEDGTSQARTYAEFLLPHGGNTNIMFTAGGYSFCSEFCLIDGKEEWIIGSHQTIYHSILARVPDNYFADKDNSCIVISDKNGVGQVINKASFSTLQSGYIADLDHKNELWHAVRCGMITSDQYQVITGETYPSTPPTRVE